MNNIENLSALERLKPDYFGFIFYPNSPRNFDRFLLPHFEKTKKAGVFVNEKITEIIKLQRQFGLEAIQLHGDENKAYIVNLKSQLPSGIEIFKAVAVFVKNDFKKVLQFEDLVDVIILDTKTKLRGGSGEKFDWEV